MAAGGGGQDNGQRLHVAEVGHQGEGPGPVVEKALRLHGDVAGHFAAAVPAEPDRVRDHGGYVQDVEVGMERPRGHIHQGDLRIAKRRLGLGKDAPLPADVHEDRIGSVDDQAVLRRVVWSRAEGGDRAQTARQECDLGQGFGHGILPDQLLELEGEFIEW